MILLEKLFEAIFCQDLGKVEEILSFSDQKFNLNIPNQVIVFLATFYQPRIAERRYCPDLSDKIEEYGAYPDDFEEWSRYQL